MAATIKARAGITARSRARTITAKPDSIVPCPPPKADISNVERPDISKLRLHARFAEVGDM